MKSLVCISAAPETTAKISFKDDDKAYDENGVQFILNPYDEWYALVRAIELKENAGGEVHVIHVGPAKNDILVRKALALGADRAVRVDTEAINSRFVAEQIAAYAKDENYDILFLGKETIDHNGAEVPAMLAELMNLPFVSFATTLEINGTDAIVTRDVDGSQEKIEVSCPFVISAAKGLAEQRIAKMKDIMMSRRKPLDVLAANGVESHVILEKFELPPAKQGVKMIDPDNMAELVRLLNQEAKVI